MTDLSTVTVVVYAPDPTDQTSGDILFCRTTSAAAAAQTTKPHIVVDGHRVDWDCTHRVEKLQLVAHAPAEVERRRGTPDALTAMKRQRDALLHAADTRFSPFEIADMAPAQRAAWRAYRQALKAMDGADPSNPVWPTPPAS